MTDILSHEALEYSSEFLDLQIAPEISEENVKDEVGSFLVYYGPFVYRAFGARSQVTKDVKEALEGARYWGITERPLDVFIIKPSPSPAPSTAENPSFYEMKTAGGCVVPPQIPKTQPSNDQGQLFIQDKAQVGRNIIHYSVNPEMLE